MANRFRTQTILMLLVSLSLVIPQESYASHQPIIRIITPSEGSMVSAPIEIIADLDLNEGDFVRITLMDTTQTLYVRKLHEPFPNNHSLYAYQTSLNFEIPTERKEALLSLEIKDHLNRFRSIRSVNLILHSEGKTEIKAQTSKKSWLIITEPLVEEKIEGGKVMVKGQVTPQAAVSIFFELITESGRVISTAQLAVNKQSESFSFETTIPYTISDIQENVLLTIRQTSPQFGTNIILDSIPITLLP